MKQTDAHAPSDDPIILLIGPLKFRNPYLIRPLGQSPLWRGHQVAKGALGGNVSPWAILTFCARAASPNSPSPMSSVPPVGPKDLPESVDYISLTTGKRRRQQYCLFLGLASLVLLTISGGLIWCLFLRSHPLPPGERSMQVIIDTGGQRNKGRGEDAPLAAHDKGAFGDFTPSNEWQVVPEGAILPTGLDIDIDFRTGVKRARLHQPAHNIHQNLPMAPGRSILEQRLEDVLSSNANVQLAALQALDVEAHTIDMGVLIARANNFSNLISLLACEDEPLRRMAGDIIEACLHLNKPAADAMLMSPLVERVVGRLTREEDPEIQRRLLNILTFFAEGSLEGVVYQFGRASGFDVLEAFLAGGFNDKQSLQPQIIVRSLALLATLAPIGDEHRDQALQLLEKYISLATQLQFNSAELDPFERVCQLSETKRLSQIRQFCKSHGK